MARWKHIETIDERLAAEQGTIFKEAPLRVALCYPSPYHIGMSSLGFQTIYREINLRPNTSAERAFLPDDPADWRASRMPLVTYERQRPVVDSEIIAFSVSYELEITGLFEMLDLAGIPALAEDRNETHPLIVAGGPLTFSNSAPL
ncbi:MAG TPA: radical SAM protein, partial [Blastocatellia bacterium]|nr:radical SAM protein [Blastocatellia bacterium]